MTMVSCKAQRAGVSWKSRCVCHDMLSGSVAGSCGLGAGRVLLPRLLAQAGCPAHIMLWKLKMQQRIGPEPAGCQYQCILCMSGLKKIKHS